ncbi:MAG: cell division protein SepF [Lachnospiraceae bacterium]|nr:cell division protein SepF [Lachnospiraceae bacterium]
MGLMDSFISAMKISEGNDDDMFEDDDEYLDDEDIATERVVSVSKTETVNEPKRQPVSRITPVRQQKKVIGSGMEVCVIKPNSVEDAREITETLLANRTVVLNMEGLDVDIAQRIIDFTSGSCYAISGNLQKISHYIFIITPASVDISGDFQEILSGSFDVPSL